MQQFTVPQFIDVEDKIIGPITARQFVIILVGIILSAIYYKIFDFSLFITAALLTIVISGIIAFFKINGRPFHYFILNIIQTLKRPGLRVWIKKEADIPSELMIRDHQVIQPDPKIELRLRPTSSRLAELSLMVDTRGVYQGEKKDGESEIKTIESLSEL